MNKTATLLTLLLASFAVHAQDHIITKETNDVPPGDYPAGLYIMDSESDNPYLHPVDAGVIFGFKPSHSNYRHVQFLARSNYFKIRTKNGTYDSWETWRTILMENQNGNVGIGTVSPTERLTVNGNISATGINRRLYLGGAGGSTFGIAYSPSYPDHGIFYTEGTPDFVSISPNGNALNGVLNVFGDGNVGIGTTTPDSMLTVRGKIHAEEVKVDLAVPGPDYVFKDDYNLITLKTLRNYIKTNGHLPNIPSAKDMEENGIALGVMNMKLLEKIEELTLYTLQQEKQIKKQQEVNELLEKRLARLEQLIQNKN